MPIPIVWTNDDIQYGDAERLARQLEFLGRHGIPGVFFLIPQTGEHTLDEDEELLKLIEASRRDGHEYFQHGHVHSPYESGVPELWMLDHSLEVKNEYDERRFEIEAQHTFEALVTMIEKGRAIWRRAFGEASPGYRPGWGARCANLYRALAALGFEWVSSTLPCPTSWLRNQGKWEAPITFRDAFPTEPHVLKGIVELPIAGDYAFRVPQEPGRIESMVELGMAEFEVYRQRQHPMLIVCHWHGLEHADGSGYAVHESLLPRIKAQADATFMNLSAALGWWRDRSGPF